MAAARQPTNGHDLRCYSPSLLLDWDDAAGAPTRHRAVEGTLVFADVSGFTRLSEALAKAGGKIGAEQMTDVINSLFGDLLLVAAARGGEMLKYGGDAMLLFFTGDDHAVHAVAACHEMQRQLHEIGRVDTGAGVVRLKMSVGVHTGRFDVFRVGSLHEELIIAGPDTTTCVDMEAAAEATEVLCSASTVSAVGERWFGTERAGGRLLARKPRVSPAEQVTAGDLLAGSGAGSEPGRFLAPPLRQYLSSGAVHSDHRLVTVAFLHIMGIDEMLLSGKTRAAADALHATVSCVQDALAAYDVTFLATDLASDGTKIMTAAGAPLAVPDDAGRMLLALRRVIESAPPLPVRAGANRGHVFSGAVGPAFRRTFTTIGDVTNTAARVMGKAASGEVLALESVVSAATPVFDVVEGQPFLAKGKTEPLVPLAVGARRRADATVVSSRSAPLIGRDPELAQLRDLVSQVAAGGTAIVDVVGEPGMGKSRLVAEVVAGSPILTWKRWVCDAYEADAPFATVRGLLLASIGDAEQLDEVVSRSAPHLLPWLPLLAGVVGIERPATSLTAGLPEARAGAQTVAVTAELLAAEAAGPLGVVVENTEWLDPSSAEVLRQLLSVRPDRMLLCTTRRQGGRSLFEEATQIALGPLDRPASEALVRRLFDHNILDHDLREIVARGEGNPFFLRELAASMRGGRELPDSLEALLATRIDDLPSPLGDALRVAAVIGRVVDGDLLRALAGDVEDALVRTGLVRRSSDGQLEFEHGLVRDVAYERLPFKRRRSLHQDVGLRLEARDDSQREPDALSLHFLHARDGERSWHYAIEAADHAMRVAAHDAAVKLYTRAMEARRYGAQPPEGALREAWVSLGNARLYAGQLEAAVAAFRSARALTRDDPVERGRTHLLEGLTWEFRGNLAKARSWYRRGLRTIGDETAREAPKWRTRLLISEALTDLRQGRYKDAHIEAAAAAEEAARLGDKPGRAHALNVQYLAATELRHPGRRSLAEEALELFAAHDPPDIVERANLLNNLGLDAQQDGDLKAALEFFEESRIAQEEAGNAVAAAAVDNNIGEIYLEQGRLDEAEALFERAEGVFNAAGSWFAHVATANRGSVALRTERTHEGIALIEKALAAARELGLKPLVEDFEQRLREHTSSG